jgi:hypothetical protein
MSKLSLITMTSSLHKEQKDVVVWRGEVKTKLSVHYAEGSTSVESALMEQAR